MRISDEELARLASAIPERWPAGAMALELQRLRRLEAAVLDCDDALLIQLPSGGGTICGTNDPRWVEPYTRREAAKAECRAAREAAARKDGE